MSRWTCVLELGEDLSITTGSEIALQESIRRGADLRIYTEFRYNEHIDVTSDNAEIVQEVSDFPVTYLVDNRWAAGIITLRMPIDPPAGFGQRPSMSFFMYNQDGQQAIARPYLDGLPATGKTGSSPLDDHRDMPKYHQLDGYDVMTNAPSSNFIYDFETFRFFVRDEWREVLSHTSEGQVISGSLETLIEAFSGGSEIKVAIRGLCSDLGGDTDHEVFIRTGSGYYNTESRLFSAGTQPVVRVKPAIPLRYESKNWDFGWLMVRTDGFVAYWFCDPYTLKFHKSEGRHAIRWFIREGD